MTLDTQWKLFESGLINRNRWMQAAFEPEAVLERHAPQLCGLLDVCKLWECSMDRLLGVLEACSDR